jgi:hypothetical protein
MTKNDELGDPLLSTRDLSGIDLPGTGRQLDQAVPAWVARIVNDGPAAYGTVPPSTHPALIKAERALASEVQWRSDEPFEGFTP